MRHVILLGLVTGAAGAASLADIIAVPVQTRYEVGTLGVGSSLLQGEASQEHADSIKRMSTMSMVITEQALAEEDARQGLLVHGMQHAQDASSSNIARDLRKEGLGDVMSLLEQNNQQELGKALTKAMILKETQGLNHMTLEETLAKQEQQKANLVESGKMFSELFQTVTTRYEKCQQCLADCPARNFEKYQQQGMHVNSEKECMKNCELVICQEVWNPLAGSYLQQLSEFKGRKTDVNVEYAKPTIFTNYLDSYHQSKGEKALYYEDEDDETEIVYDAPTPEQLQANLEHDAKLEPFLFEFNREKQYAAPIRAFRKIENKVGRHHVMSMEPAEDALATRLSRTAIEAEIIAKSAAFGVPAEWIPGFDEQ